MIKKLLSRCFAGAFIGVGIVTIITIMISLYIGDGKFYAVVPQLIEDCGSEIGAVTLQAVASMLYGAAFAGASLIWDQDRWSILKQTVIHFAICSIATFPTAYLMRWMDHSVKGILSYFGIFVAIYVGIWFAQYFSIKKRIEQMNSKLTKE